MSWSRRILPVILPMALSTTPARAAELWVDTALQAPCADYDPATRTCGAGDQTAFTALTAADAAAMPGDTVTIRAAQFSEPFVPGASGSDGAPITFRAYTDEMVVFTAIASDTGAIQVSGRAWLAFQGFIIADVGSWIRIEDSHHISVRGNLLTRATIAGTKGSIKLLRSDDCEVSENLIDDGNDNLTLVDADRNRIQSNYFTRGRHSLVSVRCGDANVFRGNYFNNEIQKSIEIYDCEGSSSDDPVIFESTTRNRWEINNFLGTAASDQPHDYNAMQFAGQDGIVRRNVYAHNLGGGVNLQVYPDEALANHGNRVYHNTFHANRCFALAASASPSPAYFDNIVTANLLFANTDCSGSGEQLAPGEPTAALFIENTLTTRDPGFLAPDDPDALDYALMPGSPVIDGGPWLTRTAGAGSGTTLTVLDARWFYDGNGIADELGDLVQLAGDDATARVLSVDLEAGTLELATPLTWSADQGLALAYAGLAPDPGAFEHDLEPDDETTTGETTSDDTDTPDPTTTGTTTAPDTPTTDPDPPDTTSSANESSSDTGTQHDAPGGCACNQTRTDLAWWLLLVPLTRARRTRSADPRPA